MKKIASILFLIVSLSGLTQVDLAIQKGHSDDILLLEFSDNGQYLASLGANNEVILWDMAHLKSLTSFTLAEIEEVKGMKFTADGEYLNVRTERTTYIYDVVHSALEERADNPDTNYRLKDYYYDEETNYEVEIIDGAIRKKRKDKRFKKYKLAVNYLNAPFNSFDVSKEQNLIVGVAEDELIYCYSYSGGLKKKVLKGHNSGIYDIRFTKDGSYFATAGRDRSIVIWNSNTFEIEARLFSNVFRKKTANFSHDGNSIYVGDELGYIYQIDLESAFPQIKVSQPNYHSVNKIYQSKLNGEEGYFLASSNNFLYYKKDPLSTKPSAKYVFRDHSILKLKTLFLQNVFKVYQPAFAEVQVMDVSSNDNFIVYTGKSDIPCIAFTNIDKNKTRRLYTKDNWKQWTDVEFISDSVFLAIQDSSNVIYHWKLDKRKFYFRTDTLPFDAQRFEYIGENRIWISSVNYGQFIYNIETRLLREKLEVSASDVFHYNNYILLASESNSIVVYDIHRQEVYHTFAGHHDRVTDINFHPEGDLFISSSDDGTVKMWSLKRKKLLVTIIPFRNEEFVFVTNDNNYLITKGALHEIGFKHEGQYFFPEQFDLKFNRPDLVLDEMGYSDSSLIRAYYQAYLKRLKKMDFTEGQLSAEFHLPEIKISNVLDIPLETDSTSIVLDLELKDEKFELDRLNIWVNDVAVHGIKGISLRDKHVKEYSQKVPVNLAFGKNKIEVSALNYTGAESYKRTVEIICTGGKKKPDLYVVTVGVSKHTDSKFNLEYADKDAVDIGSLFKENTYFKKVEILTLINEEVTLENITQIKPFLMKADIDDVVMLFVAGHGVLDDQFDYYFASHDMDFTDPSLRGIPYNTIESLLDGIRALKKLLFLDTCHSGEVDKEDVEEDSNQEENDENLIFRNVGKSIKYKDTPLGLKSTNELMKSLFTDLRKGTGATVISSSGGTELAIEGGGYQNGLFTYCLINGLQSRKADLNKDKEITVSELQIYIRSEVSKISNGRQTPTSRVQNNELDYRIW